MGLNPCCSGRWFHTLIKVFAFMGTKSLNPCCSGRWSRTAEKRSAHSKGNVLILVVMDDGLVRKTSVKFITIH